MPQTNQAPITTSLPTRFSHDASRPWWRRLREVYIFNCFWFILPILLWNLLVPLPGKYTSSTFWHDIPPVVAYGENVARMLVVLFPLLLAAGIHRRVQIVGLLLYSVGLVLYAASWLVLLLLPTSGWSTSLIGFLAPTYLPLVWAVGIGLIGDRLHWHSSYRPWIYIVMAIVFTIFHVSHAAIVFTHGA